MTSSFIPSPFKSVSGLAMLASVGAHVVFFTGSSLLSAPAPETPEKLRVVRLQRQAPSSAQQTPKNPNALLPTPPKLPPKGQSSLAGLPSLKPNAQAFRQPAKVPPKVDVQTLARKEQALRQELFLRQQQQQIQEQQKILQEQQKLAIARQKALQKAEEERNKQKETVASNPLTDDNSQREWQVGSGDGQIPPIVAAGQSPNFGQPQGSFPTGPAPADLKKQGVNSGSNASPSLNAGDATESISKTGKKATSLFTWLNKVAVATTGKVPKPKVIEQQLALPSDAVPGKDGDNDVEVRTFVSAEGEKQFTEIISESGQVPVDRAAIEAVKKYEPMESERGKALVFRYSFQPGSPVTGSTLPEQPPQTPPSEKEVTGQEQEKDQTESSDAKDNKDKEKDSKTTEEKNKDKEEKDKKTEQQDEKTKAAEETGDKDGPTSSQPEESKNPDKKAVPAPAKPPSVGGAESQKDSESSAPNADPQPSPTESPTPAPESSTSEKNKAEGEEKSSAPNSDSQPSRDEDDPLKGLGELLKKN